jgi:hypothetical protein
MKKALVLSLAVVLGLGVASFAQTLSGSWDSTIGVNPGPPVVLTIDSELIVTYSISGWSFSSDTVLDETGWISQDFAVDGALGAFTIGSALVFDPVGPAFFTSWEVTGGLSLAGVTFEGTFTLLPSVTTLELIGSGTAGAVDVTVDITFGDGLGCNFNFAGVDIEVDFPFCCADVISTISFDCTGFVEATFGVEGIALPGLPWATLDALITFTPEEKTLTITPNFDFGVEGCFDVYMTDPAGGMLFGDIAIVGIGLTCEIGGVQFTGISYWGEDPKPGILEGTDYWEAYQISTTDDGCCGPFTFDVGVYFLEGGALLFDIAELDAAMSIQISTQFTFSAGFDIVLDPVPGFTLTFGFGVEW